MGVSQGLCQGLNSGTLPEASISMVSGGLIPLTLDKGFLLLYQIIS